MTKDFRPESACAPCKELIPDLNSPPSGGCPGNSERRAARESLKPPSPVAPQSLWMKYLSHRLTHGGDDVCFKALETQNHCSPNIRARPANSIVSLASLGFVISET